MNTENMKRDPFIQSVFNEAGLEHPSDGFTDQVIKNIKVQVPEKVFAYQPVIGKKAWMVIATWIIAIVMLPILQYSGQEQGVHFLHYDLKP